MDHLLRFKSQQTTLSYDDQLQTEKKNDASIILGILLVSTLFYLADIFISIYAIYDGEKLTLTQMAVALSLQVLKVMAFIVYFKLKTSLPAFNRLLEVIFALIFTLSVLTIWNIQLSFPEPRVFIVGLDAGWNLLYLNKILSSWKLKVPFSSALMIYGIVKSQLVEGIHVLNYVQPCLQILFIIAIIYNNERKKRTGFIKVYTLQRREQTLTTILDNIPDNIVILDLQGQVIHYNQYFDTCFNVSSNSGIKEVLLKFYDIRPRERYFEQPIVRSNSKRSTLTKQPSKAIFTRTSLVRKSSSKPASLVLKKTLPNTPVNKELSDLNSNKEYFRQQSNKEFPQFHSAGKEPSRYFSNKEIFQDHRRLSIKSPSRLDVPSAKTLANFNSTIGQGISHFSLTDIMTNADHYSTLQEVINFFCTNTACLRSYLSQQNGFFIFDGKCQDIEGKVKSFEIKISIANFDSTEDCLILILRDTTHRDVLVSLEGNTTFKDSVLSSISHELRTPLNTNLNLLDIALKDVNIPQETRESLLLPAHQSGKLLQSLINDVLDYSLLLANKFLLDIKGKYLFRSVEKLRYLIEFQARKKNIEFHISISQKLTYKIWTDHRRLRQVLINLLNNAIKFTKRGHINVRIEPYEENSQLIKFTVVDTGIGISPEEVERMTDLLQRNVINQKLTNKSNELGMGLIISSRLAKTLGPANDKISGINISSTPGQGSTFWFVIENRDRSNISPAIVISPNTPLQGGQAETPDLKLLTRMVTNTGNVLLPYAHTQEELIKTLSLRRVSTSVKIRRTQGEFQGSSYFTEPTDKSALAEEDQVEEKIACVIKDDNLKMSSNAVKLFRDDGLWRGFSKGSTYSRVGTSAPGNQTPTKKLQHYRISSPRMGQSTDLPQILLNINPVMSSDMIEEENANCICPEILVADDDMFNLFTMENILKSLRLRITQATNGNEAINAILRRANFKCSQVCRNFKVVFMDLSMPTMDGFEATIKLKEMMEEKSIPEIPIVACTAFVDTDKEEQCYQIGMKAWLLKPVTKSKLIETLKKFDVDLHTAE